MFSSSVYHKFACFILVCGFAWGGHSWAMAGVEDASPETAAFVRSTLRELGVADPGDVRVWRRIVEDDDANPAEVETALKTGWIGWPPRFFCVHERGFKQLSEEQRRFVVARAVAMTRCENRLALEMLGFSLLSAVISGSLVSCYSNRDKAVRRPIRTTLSHPVLAAVAFNVLFWGSFSYTCRAQDVVLDLEAAEFAGANGGIELIKDDQRRMDQYYPRSSIWGRVVRALQALLLPSNETRLRWLRELAREQRALPPL